jgi:hemin uptake protein HemP
METPSNPPTRSPAPANNTSCRRMLSSELFKGSTVVEIDHAGQRYLLRVTRENKLILTK